MKQPRNRPSEDVSWLNQSSVLEGYDDDSDENEFFNYDP